MMGSKERYFAPLIQKSDQPEEPPQPTALGVALSPEEREELSQRDEWRHDWLFLANSSFIEVSASISSEQNKLSLGTKEKDALAMSFVEGFFNKPSCFWMTCNG